MLRYIIISTFLFCWIFQLSASSIDTLDRNAKIAVLIFPSQEYEDSIRQQVIKREQIAIAIQESLARERLAKLQSTALDSLPARKSSTGIIIVSSAPFARALEPFGGSAKAQEAYAATINNYYKTFGKSVKIYCMPIPTAVAFYCPTAVKSWSNPEPPAIQRIFKNLAEGVQAVNIFDTLAMHRQEAIYSRTDHHWAPLGAYYAAKEFANAAGLPFKTLEHYNKKVVKNYVGSMYYFSKDAAVKESPEDFVYFEPKDAEYETEYINFSLDKSKTSVVKESAKQKGNFFHAYKDGSSGAYCTFMGGDSKIVKVTTANKNGRRLIILKDSYGNALPGYFFYTFEEVHVIDCRYFNKNMQKYVKDNNITDILFANNLVHASNSRISKNYERYLVQ